MDIRYCPSPYRVVERKRSLRPLAIILGVGVVASVAAFPIFGRTNDGLTAALVVGTATLIALFISLLSTLMTAGAGETGERAALARLAVLPDSVLAIVNMLLPGYENRGDIDLLLIGGATLVVVEVKNLSGPWRVDGETWVRAADVPSQRRSVSGQLRSQIKALESYLKERGLKTPIAGVIAINSNAVIDIAQPGPYPIVPYDRLAKHVGELLGGVPPPTVARVRDHFAQLVPPPP